MEQRKLNIIFSKSGGTASKGGITNRLTVPKKWVDAMGLTAEDKEVVATFKDNKIIIRKAGTKLKSGIELEANKKDISILEKDAARIGLSISEYLLMLWRRDQEDRTNELLKEVDEFMREEDPLWDVFNTEIEEDGTCIII